MSLKGSLQTVALPEVLEFLSSTGKSGELKIEAPSGSGSLWLTDGTISGLKVDRGPNPVEAVFQLLRLHDGDFSFNVGDLRPEGVQDVDSSEGNVSAVLDAAKERLDKWADIVAVVPSLDHRLSLMPDLTADTVNLSSQQWGLVVQIGEGRTVGEVIEGRNLGEFDGCQAIKTLVETALVRIDEPAVTSGSEEALQEATSGGRWPSLSDALQGTPLFGTPATDPSPAVAEYGLGAAADDRSGQDGHLEGEFEHLGLNYLASVEPISVPDPLPMGASTMLEQAGGLTGADSEVHTEWSEDGTASIGLRRQDGGEDWIGEAVMPMSAGEALQALIAEASSESFSSAEGFASAEVAAFAAADQDQPVDGLADRGPWTHNELDSMNGWDEDETAQPFTAPVEESEDHGMPEYDAVQADDHTQTVAEDTERETDPAPVDEPINRGLLLKFLSSVRN